MRSPSKFAYVAAPTLLWAIAAGENAHAQNPNAGSAAAACFPQCRPGYVCAKGQCVSLCNPACGAGETCTATGECVSSTAPPPSTPPPPAAPPPAAPPAAPTAPSPSPTWAPTAPVPVGPTAAPVASEPPPPPPVSFAPSPAPGERDQAVATTGRGGVHLHDGFYFRFALGPAFDANNISRTTNGGNSVGYTSSGFGAGGELAFGGTPLPGLVVGGASYGAVIPSASVGSVSVNGQSAASADKKNYSGQLSMIGPFVDWYPNPAQGLHAQAAVCFSTMTVNRERDTNTFLSGSGIGFVLGGGYEGWIGEQWSLGALARVQMAIPGVHDSSNTDYASLVLVPAVLMSLTYH